MCDTFVSYARKDSALAEKLVSLLSTSGIDVWFDQFLFLDAGRQWRKVVGEKLGISKCVLVLWTPNSILSDEVYSEANFAYTQGLLIPVMTEDTLAIKYPFNQLHTITWCGTDIQQDGHVLEAVKAKVRCQKAVL